ncbi:hypothetical protein QBC44DRAFT_288254 [Cladorrhinum sp. PSN332]|nr:hypothetical protein QBC44DRAFT_288254 [Cladorrhinum sp. PSN332]
MVVSPLQLLTISVTAALSAYLGPVLVPMILDRLTPHLSELNIIPSRPSSSQISRACAPHNYSVQLISHSPLLVYISNFVTPQESRGIIEVGTPLLERSPITGDSATPEARTSSSAPLPGGDLTVRCVLERAEQFLGGLMGGRDEMGVSQMVSYGDGDKFDLHTDWFSRPKITDEDLERGRKRMYNRLATFFVVLEAEGIEEGSGETWFPFIDGEENVGEEGNSRLWRKHEDGGVAVKAVAGNAVFWVNLLVDKQNGTVTGDRRTVHAGLPVKGVGARKKAMNIWPRRFFGPDT